MQIFVSCPFCGRVFDAMTEKHTRLKVDGVQRTAHLVCAPLPAAATRLFGKPNGDAAAKEE